MVKSMKILPVDYHGEKYGLSFRLVREEDSEFIVKVRNSPQVGSFLHKTTKNVKEQREWIKRYKMREKEGHEYYLIFFKDGVPVGLNRFYNIHDTTFTGGSWAMMPNLPFEVVLSVPLIMREIAFEEMGMMLEDCYDGVHIDNKKVIKFNKMFGCKEGKHTFNELGEFIGLTLTKEDFKANKPKLLKYIGY